MLLTACSEDKLEMSSVRFRNIMYDHYEFPYGLMFGNAVFGGSLGYNETTSYIETEPGAFHIHSKRVDGEWITLSENEFYIAPGLSYTILIFGTVERLSFQFLQD